MVTAKMQRVAKELMHFQKEGEPFHIAKRLKKVIAKPIGDNFRKI